MSGDPSTLYSANRRTYRLWGILGSVIVAPIFLGIGGFFICTLCGILKFQTNVSGSMSPTIEKKELVVSTKFFGNPKTLRPGIIVGFKADGINYPGSSSPMSGLFLKRLVAVAGQTVDVRNGLLVVDGREIPSHGTPYQAVKPFAKYHLPAYPLKIPAGQIFVLGDHSGNSLDSRYFGPIDASRVVYLPKYRVLPSSRFGKLD